MTYKNDNKCMTALRGGKGGREACTYHFLFLFQDGIEPLIEFSPFLQELSYAVDKWGLVSNLPIALLMIS